MNRRNFLKSMFIFTGALWIPKTGICRMSPAIVGGGTPVVAGGYELEQSGGGGAGDANITLGQYSQNQWSSSSFTYSGTTGTITKIEAYLQKTGTGQDVTAHIYAGSSQLPTGASLGHSDTVLKADIGSASLAWISFINISVGLINGNQYCVVLQAGGNDSSNYINWEADDAANPNSTVGIDADGVPAFTSALGFASTWWRIYSGG